MKQESKPILSIITINRNNANGLKRTIESVIAQTFKDFEWIVIDGASTDESIDVIKKYAEHFTYWISEKDSGVYDAMNKGIQKAHGKYLLFMNSGDMLAENTSIEQMSLDKMDVDLIGGIAKVDDTSEMITPPAALTLRHLLQYGNVSHQACFIRRELFEKIGLYSTDLRILSDFEFMMKCAVRDCTYLGTQQIVSIVESGGLSDTECEKMHAEEQIIFDRVIPQTVQQDYMYWLNKKTYSRPSVIWFCENQHRLKLLNLIYRIFK